jgi:hypothetical protein
MNGPEDHKPMTVVIGIMIIILGTTGLLAGRAYFRFIAARVKEYGKETSEFFEAVNPLISDNETPTEILEIIDSHELAGAAHVSHSTVKDYEGGKRVPIANNLAAMKAALEAQGIVFVDSGGTCGITYAKPEKSEAH